jgi:hypothetical protein
MFKKPTEAALTALSQYVETPRWRDVDEMFEMEIEAVTQRLIGARKTADVHELKGRLATLRDIQQTAREARATLAQLGRTVPLA